MKKVAEWFMRYIVSIIKIILDYVWAVGILLLFILLSMVLIISQLVVTIVTLNRVWFFDAVVDKAIMIYNELISSEEETKEIKENEEIKETE